jgi:RNA recognition motif-containing protein
MWIRNSKGNVFVGNLPPDFPDERLAEAFDPFGIVLSARVARDPDTGARLRYGFVDIATERAATKAIEALHGTEIDGCKLNVKASEKKPKGANGNPPGGKPGMRRQAPRPAPRRILTGEDGEIAAAPGPSEPRLSQSAIAREQLDAIEPPPRRDFEVVVRPARRKTTPSFQVERRSLPPRG